MKASYIVRFVRKDGKIERKYCSDYSSALHKATHCSDDIEKYRRIEIVDRSSFRLPYFVREFVNEESS